MNWTLELIIFLIFVWLIGVLYLAPRLAKTKNFQAYGPFLMLKFVKNRGVLDRVAKRFPGFIFGKISVVIVVLSAVLALVMLGYGAYLSLYIKPANAPSLSLLVAFPGINPAIPVTFGTVALILSVVIHEVFHGIVARKHGIKVSSVGVLFFILPIGAFVEPDEKEVQEADPIHRRRLIAAGPGINIVIAIITLIVVAFLLVPSITPTHDGLYVQDVSGSSPAANFIQSGTEILSFGNYTGNQIIDMQYSSMLTPGNLYNVSVYNGKSVTNYELPAGLVIASILSGTPAANSTLSPGLVLVSMDGNPIFNYNSFENHMNTISPGTSIHLVFDNFTMTSGSLTSTAVSVNVTTMSKYDYYAQNYPTENNASYKNQSFLGVTTTYGGFLGYNLSAMKGILSGQTVFTQPWSGGLAFISLPFLYLYPVPSSLAAMFSVPFAPTIFWGILNLAYWLFWIDFLLGITNALPFLIFDGGQFFRDSLIILGKRNTFKFLREEKNVRALMNLASIVVLVLLMWQVIVPRIV